MKKIISKITAVCAAMTFAVASMGINTNAVHYSLQYHMYGGTANVVEQKLSVGTATQTHKVTVRNNCTELSNATVRTMAEAYCLAPSGGNLYYCVATVENTTTGLKTSTGSFPYVGVGDKLRNVVELQYNSSSYYTQSAKGETTSY